MRSPRPTCYSACAEELPHTHAHTKKKQNRVPPRGLRGPTPAGGSRVSSGGGSGFRQTRRRRRRRGAPKRSLRVDRPATRLRRRRSGRTAADGEPEETGAEERARGGRHTRAHARRPASLTVLAASAQVLPFFLRPFSLMSGSAAERPVRARSLARSFARSLGFPLRGGSGRERRRTGKCSSPPGCERERDGRTDEGRTGGRADSGAKARGGGGRQS